MGTYPQFYNSIILSCLLTFVSVPSGFSAPSDFNQHSSANEDAQVLDESANAAALLPVATPKVIASDDEGDEDPPDDGCPTCDYPYCLATTQNENMELFLGVTEATIAVQCYPLNDGDEKALLDSLFQPYCVYTDDYKLSHGYAPCTCDLQWDAEWSHEFWPVDEWLIDRSWHSVGDTLDFTKRGDYIVVCNAKSLPWMPCAYPTKEDQKTAVLHVTACPVQINPDPPTELGSWSGPYAGPYSRPTPGGGIEWFSDIRSKSDKTYHEVNYSVAIWPDCNDGGIINTVSGFGTRWTLRAAVALLPGVNVSLGTSPATNSSISIGSAFGPDAGFKWCKPKVYQLVIDQTESYNFYQISAEGIPGPHGYQPGIHNVGDTNEFRTVVDNACDRHDLF